MYVARKNGGGGGMSIGNVYCQNAISKQDPYSNCIVKMEEEEEQT